MFQLTDKEVSELSRSQNATLNKSTGRGSNIKYNPHAFTERGIYGNLKKKVLEYDIIKQNIDSVLQANRKSEREKETEHG